MCDKGVLIKMRTENSSPIEYFLKLGDKELSINDVIGKQVTISFDGYQCLSCGKPKKIYRQGHCYDCFYDQPAVGDWIIKPELSTAHLGIEDRDIDFEREVQLKPHIVYLALSSEVKVGVTRKSQVPTRWIDQGAHEAIEIVEVPNRYLAGITEVALKEHVADKTNWRKMLKNDIEDANLLEWRDKLKQYIPDEAKEYFIANNSETNINFPVSKYPEKPKSLNLIKTPNYKGKLVGIKGQYLIFEDETVFNIRSNEGLVVLIEV